MASDGDSKVPEDTVQYWMYLFEQTNNNVLEQLLSNACMIAADYLWHNQSFTLSYKQYPTPHLFGSVNYGENQEDEWMVVYILFELSRRFPQLVIRMRDFDGEFLLIEACDALPKWISPETAENRVFVCDGQIHLIPYSEELKSRFSKHIGNAFLGAELVHKFNNETLASTELNKAVERKLSTFPACNEANLHRTRCLLPVKVAYVLQKQPSLMAAAVRAFYCRDMLDLKACRELRHFGPINADNLVTVNVKFTRHLYAMMAKQSFCPGRRSCWPPLDRKSQDYKASDMGHKLTCGFEILCSKCSKRTEFDSGVDATEPEWVKFVESLKRSGYFQNEMEGSQKYRELSRAAKSFFSDSVASSTNPGAKVLALVKTMSEGDVAYIKQSSNDAILVEDDDSWLSVSPSDLASSLPISDSVSGLSNGAQMLAPLSDFVQKGSGPAAEGAEAPKDQIDFSPQGFISSMQQLLVLDNGPPKAERLAASSDSESYGDEDLDIDLSDEMAREMKDFGSQMQKYMRAMDKELGPSAVGESFVKKPPKSKSPAADSIDLEEDEFRAVDVDKNLVNNMLESYWSEGACSHSGPVSAMMKMADGHLADIDESDDDDL